MACATSHLAGGLLFCRFRPDQKGSDEAALLMRKQRRTDQLSSGQVVGVLSILCVVSAFALLRGLADSSSLELIQTTLQGSYQPNRLELIVGEGSILGVTTVVLLFAGCASQFGLFPLHGVLLNGFESSPAGVVFVTAVVQRLQAAVILWKVLIVAMPGFESTVQLMCVVYGITSSLCGAALTCRSESLRGLAGNFWMTWGGVALIAVAAGMATEPRAATDSAWHLPGGVENAAFSMVLSVIAIAMLLACDQWLATENRDVEFFDDLTGLGQLHRLISLAVGCSLLTLCAIPPLPGFWCVAFVVGTAFLPGAESTQGASLVPDVLIVVSAALVLISMMALASRSVSLLSLMFHHEPIRRFQVTSQRLSASVSLIVASLLLWIGISAGTVLAWIHQWL